MSKTDEDLSMMKVPIMPRTAEELAMRLNFVCEIVDESITGGLIEANMREFYIGWAYADREGFECEMGIKVLGWPVPSPTFELITAR